MSLIKYLANSLYTGEHTVISITGAGGKTSTLSALAREYKSRNLSVLITTTTKFQGPKQFNYGLDHAFSREEDVFSHEEKKGEIVYFATYSLIDMKKFTSPRLEILSILAKRYDVMIIEADGAKMLPLKLHTERDPVILDKTSATLAIMGGSSYLDYSDNTCFGYEDRVLVDIPFLQSLIDHPEGVLKRAQGKRMILINQCDTVENYHDFKGLKASCPIILGSIREDKVYV